MIKGYFFGTAGYNQLDLLVKVVSLDIIRILRVKCDVMRKMWLASKAAISQPLVSVCKHVEIQGAPVKKQRLALVTLYVSLKCLGTHVSPSNNNGCIVFNVNAIF